MADHTRLVASRFEELFTRTGEPRRIYDIQDVELWHTPTVVTEKILSEATFEGRLAAYKGWVQEVAAKAPSAMKDMPSHFAYLEREISSLSAAGWTLSWSSL